MKTFILLSAIPGSGKSTWAKRYVSEHPGTRIVSSDDLRIEFGGKPNNFDHEDEVWKAFMDRIHEYGKEDGSTVIADATMSAIRRVPTEIWICNRTRGATKYPMSLRCPPAVLSFTLWS